MWERPDSDSAVTAHVLFLDVVGYSKLSHEQQHTAVDALGAAADAISDRFGAAQERPLRAPAGDGFALVFFRDLEGPARWALAMDEQVAGGALPQLRMGIHSGPVFRTLDINQHENVGGDGINLAARVMGAARPGQILLSAATAEQLTGLDRWRPLIRRHASVIVKHGVELLTYQLGRTSSPRSFRERLHAVVIRPDLPRAERHRFYGLVALAAAIVLALAGSWAAFVMPVTTHAREYTRFWGSWVPVGPISSREATRLPVSYVFTRRGYFGRPVLVRMVDGFGLCPKPGIADILGQTLDTGCSESRGCEVRFGYGERGITEEAITDQFGRVLETLQYSDSHQALFKEAVYGCGRSHTGIRIVRFDRYPEGSGGAEGLDRRVTFFGETSSQSAPPEPRPTEMGTFGFEFFYDAGRRVTRRIALDPSGEPAFAKDGYAEVRYTYDTNNHVVNEAFLAPREQLVLSKNGTAGTRYVRDDEGRAVRAVSLGLVGQPVANAEGVAITTWDYGGHGEVLGESYLDADGRPTTNTDGIAGWRATFDRHGNRTERVFVDTGGKAVNNGKGFARETLEFDDRHVWTRWLKFDQDGKTATTVAGSTDTHDESLQAVHDERGNMVRAVYVDDNGRPRRMSDGTAGIEARFDENNLRVAADYIDTDGRHMIGADGYGGWRATFDRFGNEIAAVRVDAAGQRTTDNNGVSRLTSVFDENGRVVEETAFDLNDRLFASNVGAAMMRSKWDARGNEIERSFFDGNRRPTLHSEGIAGWRSTFDVRGREVSRMYFDRDGKPTRHNDGMVSNRQTYDDRGHVTRIENLTADGSPSLDSSGVATYEYRNDARGNTLTVRFKGVQGEPVLSSDRVAGWDVDLDPRGLELERRYIGRDGRLTANKDGVARHTRRFDDRRNLVEQLHYDAAGKLTLLEDGYAGWRSTFDDRNHETSTTFLDTAGHPAFRKGRYAVRRFKYDERGRVRETAYFDPQGLPALKDGEYAVEREVFDERGNVIEYKFIDSSGTLVRRATYSFDRFGRQTEGRFLDDKNQLKVSPLSGRAIVTFERDDAGRPVRERSFDANNRPVNRKDLGWFERLYTYSDTGVQLSMQCRRVDGSPVPVCKQ